MLLCSGRDALRSSFLGFNVPLPSMSKPLRWLSCVSPCRWAFEALVAVLLGPYERGTDASRFYFGRSRNPARAAAAALAALGAVALLCIYAALSVRAQQPSDVEDSSRSSGTRVDAVREAILQHARRLEADLASADEGEGEEGDWTAARTTRGCVQEESGSLGLELRSIGEAAREEPASPLFASEAASNHSISIEHFSLCVLRVVESGVWAKSVRWRVFLESPRDTCASSLELSKGVQIGLEKRTTEFQRNETSIDTVCVCGGAGRRTDWTRCGARASRWASPT